MTSSDLQLIPCDWLIVGFRGNQTKLKAAEELCRLFEGVVICSAPDTLIVEVGAYPEVIDELLSKLNDHGVTHTWRSGVAKECSSHPPFCDN